MLSGRGRSAFARSFSWFRRETTAPSRRARRTGSSPRPSRLLFEPLEGRHLLSVMPVGGEIDLFPDIRFEAPAIAMAPDGEFIVVAHGKRGGANERQGIFARRFDPLGAPLGDFFQVNMTAGPQTAPSIAMNAAGESVVAWTGSGRQGLGLYARRFDQHGVPVNDEFAVALRVSGLPWDLPYRAVVSMEADGDFAVVWNSAIDPSRENEDELESIFVQRYDADGVRRGDPLLVVQNPGDRSGEVERHSFTVDGDGAGNLAVTWRDGLGHVFIRRIDTAGDMKPAVFLGDIGRSSTPLATDTNAAGETALVFPTPSPGPRDVQLQRYDAAGAPIGARIQLPAWDYTHDMFGISVAMDARGGFTVAWREDFEPNDPDDAIYVQQFSADGRPVAEPFVALPEVIGVHSDLSPPKIASDADGDFVVVSVKSPFGVAQARVFRDPDHPLFDTPQVQQILVADGANVVKEGERLLHPISEIVASFGESEMSTTGPASVTNPANWSLFSGGRDISDAIADIGYAFNPARGRHEARFTLVAPLGDGQYTLFARDSLENIDGVPLDGDLDGAPGGEFRRVFSIRVPVAEGSPRTVNTFIPGNQSLSTESRRAVATDADGNAVVVWTSEEQGDDGLGVFGQRFAADGSPVGPELHINTTTIGDQAAPGVAMAPDGRFVVTWSGGEGADVFAQRFSPQGARVGDELLVNTTTTGVQSTPSAAIDAAGNFVISWESEGQDGFGYGIYVQLFDADGAPRQAEWRVNTETLSDQRWPSTAMKADGDFVVTWSSFGQDGSGYGVYAQRFNSNRIRRGDEFRVNTTTGGTQQRSSAAIDADGDAVIVWESLGQDGDGWGVYAQRYNRIGEAVGGETLVNTTTAGDQQQASAAYDADGDYVITWASLEPEGDGGNVYAQRFDSGLRIGGEFQVNTVAPRGDQFSPSVALDPDGDFIIAWTGQDREGEGVFAQWHRAENVLNFPPTARAGGPYTIAEGQGLSLDASASSDLDEGDVLRFSWDVNGDGLFEDAEGERPSLSSSDLQALGVDDGPLTITNLRVRVTDRAGAVSDSPPAMLTVMNVAPTIAVTVTPEVNEGSAATIMLGALTDPGADAVTEWIVHWGDGTSDTYSSGGAKTHVYGDGPAQRAIVVDLVDDDGLHEGAGGATLQVHNVAPELSDLSITSVQENETVHVLGVISDLGFDDTFTIAVFWGDGSPMETFTFPAGTREFDITHLYRDDPAGPPPDEYPVNLILRDDDGGQATASLRATVANVAPRVTMQGAADTGEVGVRINLTSTLEDQGPLDVLVDEWLVTKNFAFFAEGSGRQFSFTPDGAGRYDVRFTVRDDDGGVGAATAIIGVDCNIFADLNGNCLVDVSDLNAVRNNFGARGENVPGDTNADGVVDLADLNNVRNNFGATVEPDPVAAAGRAAENLEPAAGEAMGDSDPQRVNVITAGRQETTTRAIGVDAAGNSVVVWQGELRSGGDWSVFARRYDADGEPLGDPFVVGAPSERSPFPSVAVNADGEFAIAWVEHDASHVQQWVHRFSASGESRWQRGVGSSFNLEPPRVAINQQGDVVVGVTHAGVEFVSPTLFKFNASGGQVFRESLPLSRPMNSVILQDDGKIVYVSSNGLVRLDAAGQPDGETIGLNERIADAVVTPDGGLFAVTFTRSPSTTIDLHRFDAAGAPIGDSLEVGGFSGGRRFDPPSITIDEDGDFAVSWTDDGVSQVRFFTSSAVPLHSVILGDSSAGASIAMRGDGDVSAVWSVEGPPPDIWDVFTQRLLLNPFPKDVFVDAHSDPLAERPHFFGEVGRFVVEFSEAMNPLDVVNLANWSIVRNGEDLSDPIAEITFGLNSTTNRHEAVVSLSQTLTPGDYTLGLNDEIADLDGLMLDGDLDGQAGGDFRLSFRIDEPIAKYGVEFRVNTIETGENFSSNTAMAPDGSFVVAWQNFIRGTNGQALNRRILGQRYNSDGVPQGPEFEINDPLHHDSHSSTVAVANDGSFGVIWVARPEAGAPFEVWFRRYDAAGNLLIDTQRLEIPTFPFRLAMDASGDFVATWIGSTGQGSTFRNVLFAQRYGANGVPLGEPIQVDVSDDHEVSWEGFEGFPDVAMDDDGGFLVTWRTGDDHFSRRLVFQRFDPSGTRAGDAVVFDGAVIESHVAMRGDGGFAIVRIDRGASNAPILARVFDRDGTPRGEWVQANTQPGRSPGIAMDESGAFFVSWFGAGNDNRAYARRFSADGIALGDPFEVAHDVEVQSPGWVAASANGDFLFTWARLVSEPFAGVYGKRFASVASLTNVYVAQGRNRVTEGERISHAVPTLHASITRPLSVDGGATGAHSVLNLANWTLSREGVDVTSQIAEITFGFNAAENYYEAVLVFDAPLSDGSYVLTASDAIQDTAEIQLDGDADGVAGGQFQRSFAIIVDCQVLGDMNGNCEVDMEDLNAVRNNFGAVGENPPGDTNADGVIDLADLNNVRNNFGATVEPDPAPAPAAANGASTHRLEQPVAMQKMLSPMPLGPEINLFSELYINFADIAIDADGNFIVAGRVKLPEGEGYQVIAQRYTAAGVPLGDLLQIDTVPLGETFGGGSVAMNAHGDFVVSWTGMGREGQGVYMRRYDRHGFPLDDEITVVLEPVEEPDTFISGLDLAINDAREVAATWRVTFDNGDFQIPNRVALFSQRFSSSGAPRGNALRWSGCRLSYMSCSVAFDNAGNSMLMAGSPQSEFDRHMDVSVYRADASGRIGALLRLPNFAERPSLAMNSLGAAAIVYTEVRVGEPSRVLVRRFDREGNFDGPPMQIEDRQLPFSQSIALDDSGGFVITWAGDRFSNTLRKVFVQYFSPLGVAGDIITVTEQAADSSVPEVVTNADGEFVVRWRLGAANGGHAWKAQVFRAPDCPVSADLNCDGVVGMEDLNAVRNNFGAVGENPPGDTNADGVIDLADLNNVRNNFGATVEPAQVALHAIQPTNDGASALNNQAAKVALAAPRLALRPAAVSSISTRAVDLAIERSGALGLWSAELPATLRRVALGRVALGHIALDQHGPAKRPVLAARQTTLPHDGRLPHTHDSAASLRTRASRGHAVETPRVWDEALLELTGRIR